MAVALQKRGNYDKENSNIWGGEGWFGKGDATNFYHSKFGIGFYNRNSEQLSGFNWFAAGLV